MPYITVSSEYMWVLFTAVAIAAQCTMIGFSVGPLRSKFFNKKFMEANFPANKDIHGSHGYPDNGSGIFADKLAVDDWITFNNAQRAHYNYLEGLPATIVSLLVAGLAYPKVCALLLASHYRVTLPLPLLSPRPKPLLTSLPSPPPRLPLSLALPRPPPAVCRHHRPRRHHRPHLLHPRLQD